MSAATPFARPIVRRSPPSKQMGELRFHLTHHTIGELGSLCLACSQIGQAGFGGGQGFFFFAESEANLGGAVLWIVVEARTRDRRYADFFD